jgi:hypothetical protein
MHAASFINTMSSVSKVERIIATCIYMMYRIIVEQMKMGGEKRAMYKGDQELGFQVIRSIASLLLDDAWNHSIHGQLKAK